jgi:uncharacterized protein (DUF1697 family)
VSSARAYARGIETWIALLRGINVGGRNRLPMTELRALHERLGHEDVRTHLQTGNVVFRAREDDEQALARTLVTALDADLAITCTVILRSPAELAAVVAANPFADRIAGARGAATDAQAKALHVTFLDAPAARDAFADLDPASHAPDELVASGREVYLWCPGGYGRTKLTTTFLERRAGCAATDRNWNTVSALAAAAAG